MNLRLVTAAASAVICLAAPVLAYGQPKPSGSAQSVEAGPRSASEPERIVGAFHDAPKRGDQNAASALILEDALIFEEGHVERSKAEYVQGHLPSDVMFAKATAHALTSRAAWSSADLAYVVSEGRTSGEFRGKPVDRIVLETIVLRKRPEGWRIAHIHWSSRAGGK